MKCQGKNYDTNNCSNATLNWFPCVDVLQMQGLSHDLNLRRNFLADYVAKGVLMTKQLSNLSYNWGECDQFALILSGCNQLIMHNLFSCLNF